MEFHLINHPLDCPVCDQAGECWLQIYYMKHGLYDPRMTDEKVHKPKAVPLGPHVMLDAERCILCSRCVRFCDEITGTGELGIFERGDHSEIGLFPGTELDNKYSGNVVDICPVGALTDRDFRFQVRVWYLDTAKSVCPGCARGCNIEVHVNRRRPHHAEGRRVARLKPRFNADVNRVVALRRRAATASAPSTRPTGCCVPTRREGETTTAATWDEAIGAVAGALRRGPADEIGVIASPRMANEDLAALRRVLDVGAHPARRRSRCRRARPATRTRFLIRADKKPNALGAELIGLGREATARDSGRGARAAAQAASGSSTTTCWRARGRKRRCSRRSRAVETIIFTGTNANRTSARAHWVLPAAAWVEREGTFTNFEGRVQRFRPAVEPLGQALAEWEMLGRVLAAARRGAGGDPGRALVPPPRRRRARLRGPQLSVDRRHRSRAHPGRPGALMIADLGIAFGRVAFVMLFVLNLGGL